MTSTPELPDDLCCSVRECGSPVLARNWCTKHYGRWKAHGDPTYTVHDIDEKAAWFDNATSTDSDECIVWPWRCDPDGYGLYKHKGKFSRSHLVVLERTAGPKPDGMECAHSCGNPPCGNHRHLRWATHRDNIADKRNHGTLLIGEIHPRSILNEAIVRDIRVRRDMGEQIKAIAAAHGVNWYTVRDVLSGRTWSHVSARPPVEDNT